jgi:hypothetical protein
LETHNLAHLENLPVQEIDDKTLVFLLLRHLAKTRQAKNFQFAAMADADEYRRCANECMRLADTANNIEVKTRLLKQAYGWFEVAFQHLTSPRGEIIGQRA